jgi:hypothetical protein
MRKTIICKRCGVVVEKRSRFAEFCTRECKCLWYNERVDKGLRLLEDIDAGKKMIVSTSEVA